MGLTDPSLVGAIDVHLHLDPDAPGAGGVIRAIDVFDVHEGTILWDNESRKLEIEMADAVPLLGMRLLAKHQLKINVEHEGSVEITPIANHK